VIARCAPCEPGNAAVEFALSISVLAVLFTGVYQYGYTMYAYNALETGVANAARSALRTTLRADSKAAYRAALQNLVVYGNTTGAGAALVPGLTPAHVNVTLTPDSATAAPETVTVAINGYTIDGMFGRYQMTNSPRLTMPYSGNFMVPGPSSGSGGSGTRDHRNRGRRGQALLESSLVFMATLMMIVGIIGFGQVLMTIQMTNERARAGARWACTHTVDATRVKNYVAYGRESVPADGSASGIFGLRPEHVTVQRLDNGTPTDPYDDQVQVVVRKPVTWISPYIARTFQPKPAVAASLHIARGATE
jgi:Flp pilus assembly protein TadG